MTARDHPRPGWTIALRRQPARSCRAGRKAAAYELICCNCGDHPDLDYSEVAPELQRVRGPCPIAAGVTAYQKHRRLHQQPAGPPACGR